MFLDHQIPVWVANFLNLTKVNYILHILLSIDNMKFQSKLQISLCNIGVNQKFKSSYGPVTLFYFSRLALRDYDFKISKPIATIIVCCLGNLVCLSRLKNHSKINVVLNAGVVITGSPPPPAAHRPFPSKNLLIT